MEQDKKSYLIIFSSFPFLRSIFPRKEASQKVFGLEIINPYAYSDIPDLYNIMELEMKRLE